MGIARVAQCIHIPVIATWAAGADG